MSDYFIIREYLLSLCPPFVNAVLNQIDFFISLKGQVNHTALPESRLVALCLKHKNIYKKKLF